MRMLAPRRAHAVRFASHLLALAVAAMATSASAQEEVSPRFAGAEANLGPPAATWSGQAFTAEGLRFAGFDEAEEASIREALGALPASLKADGITVEKGGADSYTPASHGGAVIIVGENQILAGFLAGSLVHELAHSWAQRNGPDQRRYLLWSFGRTVGSGFAASEDAFANEYARGCVQAARELLGFLHLGAVDPKRLAAAGGLFEEDFANTVHERFLSLTSGAAIQWIDILGEPIRDPHAGERKLSRVRELLAW